MKASYIHIILQLHQRGQSARAVQVLSIVYRYIQPAALAALVDVIGCHINIEKGSK